ncbi:MULTISPECIES: S1C family serine protease [unclassified Thioalkalivibrio]|nr:MULTISPECIES: trypsin-like peptidase domain-containing protein [unclassified Thioalkalivibrio]
MHPTLERFIFAGTSVMVAFSLAGCLAGPAPKPTEAVYDDNFSQADHVERLVREGRISEAFTVYMEIEEGQDPRWSVIRDLAQGLAESPDSEDYLTALGNQLQALSVESAPESWPEKRHLFGRASTLSSIYDGQQDVDDRDAVGNFVSAVDQARAEWYLAKPRLVSECGMSGFRECVDLYPVPSEFDDWGDQSRSELALALISQVDLDSSSSSALRELFDHADAVYEMIEVERPEGVIPESYVIDQTLWSTAGDGSEAAGANLKLGSVYPSPVQPNEVVIEDIWGSPGHRFQVFLVRSRESVTPSELAVYSQPSEFRVSERHVPNPEYQRAQARVNNLRAQLQQAQTSAAYAQDPISQGFAQGQAMGLQSRLTNAINRLGSIPMQVTEPVYQTYEYSVRKMRLDKESRFEILVVDHEHDRVGRGSITVRDTKEAEVASGVRAHDRFNRHSSDGVREISESFRELTVSLAPKDVVGNLQFGSGPSNERTLVALLDQGRVVSSRHDAGERVGAPSGEPEVGAASFFPSVVVVSAGGLGSGFYVRENLVVTNAHVVEDVLNPEIRNRDGRVHVGRVIATDSAGDLALVEVRELGVPLPLHSGAVPVGEDVVAIGHPRGLEFTITRGVISASRYRSNFGESIPVLQTDTAINPGNSGGPLLLNGEVLGVNTALLADSQGIGFAVHADRVRQILGAAGR